MRSPPTATHIERVRPLTGNTTLNETTKTKASGRDDLIPEKHSACACRNRIGANRELIMKNKQRNLANIRLLSTYSRSVARACVIVAVFGLLPGSEPMAKCTWRF